MSYSLLQQSRNFVIHFGHAIFMKTTFGCALILTAAMFFSGCAKSKPPVAQAPPPVADTNPPAAVTHAPVYASAPVTIAASPNGGADLKQLNHAYIGWIVANRRHPKDFAEYVALSGVQVPPPPAGKKYFIDKYGFINLENN
jgi:hypothetical protein